MTLILGFYSSTPQSGKSTTSNVLKAHFTTTVVKISGAMKDMNVAILNQTEVFQSTINTQDIWAWVDGKDKDSVVPNLTPDTACTTHTVNAFLDSVSTFMGADASILDETGQPLTQERLMVDMNTIWKPVLQDLFAQQGGLTCRDIQKTIGLEWFRKTYGFNIWISMVEQIIQNATTDIVVVDDVRFEADADLVVRNGGLLVYISRPQDNVSGTHASEGLLENNPFDVRLVNNSTLDDFETQINTKLIPLVTKNMK